MVKKKSTKPTNGNKPKAKSRKRGRKPYPVVIFEEALKIAHGIMLHAAGNPVRRLRLLELMNLNPNATLTRDMITNSGKYGITSGSYNANELSLTPKGRLVVNPASNEKEKRQASFDLAIAEIEPFKKLYDKYAGKSMPSLEVMQDDLGNIDVGDRRPCVDIFVGNANWVGLLKTIGGARHLLSIEDAFSDITTASLQKQSSDGENVPEKGNQEETNYNNICFFISPIGDKKSDDQQSREHRQHSDTLLNQYVRRALEEQSLEVIRADEIAESGMISKQIIEYILNSCLVIADLSYNNPNVFYELCLRHVTGKPTVHLIRKGDKIPFDVGNFRTITIALDNVHEAIAEIDTHRAEIANFVRQAISAGESKDNPILTFYPKAKFMTEGE